MTRISAAVRTIVGALALVCAIALLTPAASTAQVNPNAAAVSEEQLLNQSDVIRGLGTIPDTKSYVLEHPAGREWRVFRTVWLKWIGGVSILGMLALLALFYFWRGTIHIDGGRSGRTIVRFTAFERFVHWLTAAAFVILGVTGLNITFGRALILPWLGHGAFSAWSEWGKYAHNYLSFAFTVGVILMFPMWVGQNFPTKADVEWLKTGGGMFSKGHGAPAPAWKFNAGQKMLYWFIVLGGAAMMVTGYVLIFPFYGGLTVGDMELAEIFHGGIGVLFVALILAHTYLGTLGMEGAFESMVDGTVDVNWAKEHHPLWADKEMAQQPLAGGPGLVTSTPAE